MAYGIQINNANSRVILDHNYQIPNLVFGPQTVSIVSTSTDGTPLLTNPLLLRDNGYINHSSYITVPGLADTAANKLIYQIFVFDLVTNVLQESTLGVFVKPYIERGTNQFRIRIEQPVAIELTHQYRVLVYRF